MQASEEVSFLLKTLVTGICVVLLLLLFFAGKDPFYTKDTR